MAPPHRRPLDSPVAGVGSTRGGGGKRLQKTRRRFLKRGQGRWVRRAAWRAWNADFEAADTTQILHTRSGTTTDALEKLAKSSARSGI